MADPTNGHPTGRDRAGGDPTGGGPRIVDTPQAWLGADLDATDEWRHTFTTGELDELDRALTTARARSAQLDLGALSTVEFPLPTLSSLVDRVRSQLVERHGVMLIDGFDPGRYTIAELRAVWYLLNLHIGTPVTQSWRGDLLGDVRDLGTGIDGAAGRGYTSNQELSLHSDQADVTCLFVLRRARSGGVTRLASSVAVHNEIIRRRPEVMELLYEPMPVSWQSNQPPGERAWYLQPVYGRHGDHVCCAYVPSNITLAATNVGAPPLRAEQHEAVGYVRTVADEPAFGVERHLDEGTMLWVSNHTAFHMRTAFEDWPEPERRRHLLRIWLSLPNGRRLPDTFAGFFDDLSAGAVRGGFPSRDGTTCFSTT